jgi:ferredoxin--NADP+ reductase
MSVSVAIVGSGPAGFYTADALVKSDADYRIDIIERLPTPFGLIRYGVSPDHETTRKVSKAFERTALAEPVRYYGNVELGRDVGFEELRSLYDAVVLTVGMPLDRMAGIPGEDKAGVIGAAAFIGWYNGHPDFTGLDPDLDTQAAAVIGVGNVALDVARILAKTRAELAATDMPDHALDAIDKASFDDIHIFGRRGPVEAKFSNVELREMGELEKGVPVVDGAVIPDAVSSDLAERDLRLKEKNLATLREFAGLKAEPGKTRLNFQFYAAPVEVLGGERVEGLRLERTAVVEGRAVGSGEFFEVPCGLVVPAIGYRCQLPEGVPLDARRGTVENTDGRVADGVYAAGWIMRGPTGVISSNRTDGRLVAGHIDADIKDGKKPGREGLIALLADRGVTHISYADWQKIESAEIAGARAGAPRCKFVTVDEMMTAAGVETAKREAG